MSVSVVEMCNVTSLHENLIVHIGSAHRLPLQWKNTSVFALLFLFVYVCFSSYFSFLLLFRTSGL